MVNIRYVGSKNKISKEIAPIIQKCIDDNNIKTYFEPFVGGANMIDKIICDTKIGNDMNEYLIALLKIEKYVIERTKIPQSKLDEIKEKKIDWYIPAEEALSLGIIDEIL